MLRQIHILHSRYFLAFIIPFIAVLVEFNYFLFVEINNNVLLFALFTGGIFTVLAYQKKHGRLHLGVVMFLLGFLLILLAGGPLIGTAEIGTHKELWNIEDQQTKTILAVLTFMGMILIFINFKAYMTNGNWTGARPLK